MALLLKCGAVFLHVPKTGGSWVARVLEEQGLVRRPIGHIHADMQQVRRYLNATATIGKEISTVLKARLPREAKRWVKRMLGKATKPGQWPPSRETIDRTPYMFCFARHPLSWYESIWRYMCKNNWPSLGNRYDVHDWHPIAMLNGLGDADFNRFMRNVIERRPGFVTELYGWYMLPGMNFVGKQERLTEDLVDVLGRLNVEFDQAGVRQHRPLNVTRSANQPIVWDEGLRQEVLRLEAAAIARCGY